MQNTYEEREDVFFDSLDYTSTSFSSASSENILTENFELEFENFDCEFWKNELKSIRERRDSFLSRMGFTDLMPSESYCSQGIMQECCSGSSQQLGFCGIMESCNAVCNSPNCSSERKEGDRHRVRDLGREETFVMDELDQDSPPRTTHREVDSVRQIIGNEFEMPLGLSHTLQKLLRKENLSCGEKRDGGIAMGKKKVKSWWKGFLARMNFGVLCECSESVHNAQIHKSGMTRVQHHGKHGEEFTAVYMDQGFQAHKGTILAMKFSPDGRYLATGGEDSLVRIWRVMEVEATCKYLTGCCVPTFVDKLNDCKLTPRSRCFDSAPLAIPKKTFKLEEMPLHEFHGHTSDVLDISWSKSNCLLTSSKDKTIRMWKVGQDHCLGVFLHNDYVTCVQFNPVDDGCFISGSIDGKVRIWRISESRVVDWVDIRDIVSAVCYRPDGQGFIVGSITGNCRIYNLLDNCLQLDAELNIQGKKKATGKRITGFQFTLEDPEKVMITSADSRVQIVNGVNVIHKYGGLRKAKNQLSASFTSDGRYIVSVSEDSRVYVWNYVSDSPSSKGTRSVRSCACFSSKDVSIAIPWPGTDHLEPDSRSRSSHLQPQKIFAPSTCIEGAECFSLGAWFFSDCQSRASATWPEEKLGLSAGDATVGYCPLNGYDDHQHYLKSLPPATWSRVIVTAGHDGTIKSFHNYGLPVRL